MLDISSAKRIPLDDDVHSSENCSANETSRKIRYPSPSGTDATGASSINTQATVMPSTNVTQHFSHEIQFSCASDSSCTNATTDAGTVPQVILLANDILSQGANADVQTVKSSKRVHRQRSITNSDDSCSELLNASQSTNTSTDTSVTSVTSSNRALSEETINNTLAVENKIYKYLGLSAFNQFRTQYLIVHTAIMLADGLQGTHLYVLYEGYGYSVSSLYSLGFVAGAFTSPFIGPIVDKIGRKKAAMLYCFLEMIINYLELFPNIFGLITSRMIGGITTNLLFSVFESWLVSEHRSRGFEEEKLEIILRDSTIVSNSAAILSGYIAHCLASNLGAVGPFQGAVVLTSVALILVGTMWTENFGKGKSASRELTTWKTNMVGAFNTIINDSKISRIGLIQGLSQGALQTFVFLWSPALRTFAKHARNGVLGMDTDGQPAYGLIFGAFMACGVLGGFSEPVFHRAVARITSTSRSRMEDPSTLNSAADDCCEGDVKPFAVDFLCTICYLISAALFLVPVLVPKESVHSFSICFLAFLVYELIVGLYMPCEGVIRSIYMPNDSICSLMTMLRVIVNVAVALGVMSTNYVPFTSAFAALSVMMVIAAILQISLVPKEELSLMMKEFRMSRRAKKVKIV